MCGIRVKRLARETQEAAEQAELVRRSIESGAVDHEPFDGGASRDC